MNKIKIVKAQTSKECEAAVNEFLASHTDAKVAGAFSADTKWGLQFYVVLKYRA